MSRRALIVQGGWDGHQPREVASFLQSVLESEAFETDVSETLDVFDDPDRLGSFDLIVPVWTMGRLTEAQQRNVCSAVEGGVGIAGCHGGMCDAFRESTEWHFMTGGQWVAHPGNDGTRYTVHITSQSSPITEGIGDYEVSTEQYYLHVDPVVKVLATCRFPVADGPHVPNGAVDMPVIWTKRYGKGRVYFNALGHQADVVAEEPTKTLIRRGFLWAAR